jgi:nitric oxide reductase NorD protein
MAEAEDVIIDAARHGTAYVQALWRRHRPRPAGAATLRLADCAQRLDLLLAAAFGRSFPLRSAQPPKPAGLLARLAGMGRGPRVAAALPATDGTHLWLPPDLGLDDETDAAQTYRLLALQQAMRACRGSAAWWARASTPLERELVLLLEADAADAALMRALPGLARPLHALRARALAARPPLARFPAGRRALEQALRERLAQAPEASRPDAVLERARSWARDFAGSTARDTPALFKDQWTGELRAPPAGTAPPEIIADEPPAPDRKAPRSARLARAPRVRTAPDDDDTGPGAWMVQTAQPHEMAADPMGLQRPTDRDADTAAEDFAEDLSELAEARQIATPGQSREVLLADDPPEAPARAAPRTAADGAGGRALDYPEWDFKAGAYRYPGARVHLLPAAGGDPAWVEATLAEHRGLLAGVRRGFETLKAERADLRRQLDGDDIDLEALVEARADYAAGRPLAQAVYRATRPARRSLAITLLVDISGSTDSWVSARRRVIDVEREALLLVCMALESLREAYAVLGFSGQGMRGVTVRELKRFDEPYAEPVALRIAALEPEHYTRTGAALRHAAAGLMRQPARHRLLLLLSDGKPNDDDHYEGRYGVEDLRQAVVEARLQGISPFCLTIDRAASAYLARVFGAHHYALLREPDRLPGALLAWMRRLVLH